MKTIFLNIFDSNMARNFLRTDVLKTLKAVSGVRLVILVPRGKFDNYSKEFKDINVELDKLPQVKPSKLELVAITASRYSIPSHTTRQIIEDGWSGEGRLPLFKYWPARILSFMSRFDWWKKIMRAILSLPFKADVYKDLFEKYKPDLIFSPTIYSENDLRLIKYAKKKKVTTIGMIKSWDNLTSKDFLTIHPDFLIVHNDRIKKEAVFYGNYPESNIFVSGIPQFDRYADKDFMMNREEFFDKFKLDKNRKLITYTAVGSYLFPKEREAIELLSKIVSEQRLDFPSQLYVRLHPAFASEEKFLLNIPNMKLFRPGGTSVTQDVVKAMWEFDETETKILASTIQYSDVSINAGSTMSIECAYFDRPVINIGFDSVRGNDSYWKSVRRLYTREHYKPLVEYGGLRIANNETELINLINSYLKDPLKDRDGRMRVKQDQCYKFDGRSGIRIGEFIISKL